jgi:spore coat protein U-like protein
MRPVDRRLLSLAAAGLACFVATPAGAACTATTVGVAFGAYDPQAAGPDDGTGTVNVRCLFFDSAVDSIALGTGGSGTYFPRRMTGGAFNLNYNLYTTAARTNVWGNGGGGTQTVTPGGTFNFPFINYSATVYGRIPALQNVGAGTYTDTVVVTVTW